MKTIFIYPGSFNPFTIGHKNIVDKMSTMFGRENILIAFGLNPSKTISDIDDININISKLSSKLNVAVEVYTNFLHELIQEKESEGLKVILVRGLRNGDDLDYEENQLKYIKDFKDDLNVIFIRCDEKYDHISSSSVRQLEAFRKGSGDSYLVKLD